MTGGNMTGGNMSMTSETTGDCGGDADDGDESLTLKSQKEDFAA
jgi:hypothetical protein